MIDRIFVVLYILIFFCINEMLGYLCIFVWFKGLFNKDVFYFKSYFLNILIDCCLVFFWENFVYFFLI